MILTERLMEVMREIYCYCLHYHNWIKHQEDPDVYRCPLDGFLWKNV